MSVMLSKTYAAHRAANAPEKVAREAAEEVGRLDSCLQRLEVRMNVVVALNVAMALLLLNLTVR